MNSIMAFAVSYFPIYFPVKLFHLKKCELVAQRIYIVSSPISLRISASASGPETASILPDRKAIIWSSASRATHVPSPRPPEGSPANNHQYRPSQSDDRRASSQRSLLPYPGKLNHRPFGRNPRVHLRLSYASPSRERAGDRAKRRRAEEEPPPGRERTDEGETSTWIASKSRNPGPRTPGTCSIQCLLGGIAPRPSSCLLGTRSLSITARATPSPVPQRSPASPHPHFRDRRMKRLKSVVPIPWASKTPGTIPVPCEAPHRKSRACWWCG